MSPQELATRQALEILHITIQDLCLRRDQLAASLPRAKKADPLKVSCTGMEIKLGGGKKKETGDGMNRRRSRLSDRDVENKVIAGVIYLAICFFCTSLFLLTLADHACGPAVHAAPSVDVVHGSQRSLLMPEARRQASEQAGQLAAFYRENF